VGDISIAYRSIGRGRPLVLVQGSGAAMDVWDPLMIQALARHRRVIVYDHRGVGGSTDDPTVPMTIDLLAEDAYGLVDALGLRRPDVLGWSLGGYVGQRLIELHPDRVRKLVLIATDPGGSQAVLASPDVLELDARVTLGQATVEEIIAYLFPPEQEDAGWAWLDRYLGQPGCCAVVPYETGVRQLEAVAAWIDGPESSDGLGDVRRPVLLLQGARDIAVPPINAERLADRLPNATLVTFADAGHGLPLQEPRLVAGLVNGFLG